MRERKEVLDYGLTLPDTYIDTPFHDDNCRQPPLTVIRAILSGQTGTSPAINRYAAKGSLHE